MAQNSKLGKQYRRDERQIAGTNIHVGQLQWGLQTIKSWSNAVQAAESVHNPRRKPLYDFYNNIEKDPHLDSIMDKRTRAVKTGELVWEGITNDNMLKQLRSPWMLDLLGQIMSRVFYGYTLLYFKTNSSGIMDVEIVPRQNVNPELGLITKEMYGNTGISYLEGRYPKLIMPIGKPSQLGKLSRVGPYALMKKDNLVFYAYHNQFFGMPLRVYYYEPGNMTQRREMESAAEAAQAAPYMVVPRMPSGSGVDVKDSNKSGASTAYGDFHKIMNDEMSISILGQTLTTSNDGVGSNALGRVHEAVEEAVNLEDMLTTEYILNFQVLPILRANGYPIPEGAECHFKRTERLSGVQKIQMFATAAQHTLIKDEDWHNVLGTEMPTEAELKKFREGAVRPPAIPGNKIPDDVEEEVEEEDPILETPRGSQKKKTKAGVNTSQLEGRIQAYYGPTYQLNAADSDGLFGPEYEKALNNAIKQIHSGKVKAGDIDPEFIKITAEKLFKGVQKGYNTMLGSLEFGTPDFAMLAALRSNVYQFSAWKNYGFNNAASELLLNADGSIRSFQEFFDEVRPQLASKYYDSWIISEYNTAIGKAQGARKWLEIERRGEVVMLRWRTANDSRVRDSHSALHGVTLPSDHDFWKTHWTPLDYNCRCAISVEHDAAPQEPETNITGPSGFSRNPGAYREIFSPDHPYFGTTELDTLKAYKDVRSAAVKEVRDQAALWSNMNLAGSSVEYPGVGTIDINRKGIKHLLAQNELEAMLALYDLKLLVASASGVEYEPDYKGRKDIKGVYRLFNTYKIGAKSFKVIILIREQENGRKHVYDMLMEVQ